MSVFFNQILTDDGFHGGAGNFISSNSVKHGLQPIWPIFARPKVSIEDKRTVVLFIIIIFYTQVDSLIVSWNLEDSLLKIGFEMFLLPLIAKSWLDFPHLFYSWVYKMLKLLNDIKKFLMPCSIILVLKKWGEAL